MLECDACACIGIANDKLAASVRSVERDARVGGEHIVEAAQDLGKPRGARVR